jgi:hypothetical protein
MNHRFNIGDRVRVTGILGEFYRAKTGNVVAVEPNATGITELDLYVIEIPGLTMGDTKFADFQLALASDESGQSHKTV